MERLKSLSELLGFENRIVYKNQKPDMSLLNIIPNINYEILDKKRQESNDYIIRNLKNVDLDKLNNGISKEIEEKYNQNKIKISFKY